jgi:two-component system OmpR family response regulator
MIEILMVEDDLELSEIISDNLNEYDIKVTNYENPIDGILALKDKIYDLVILDLSLPNMDGLDVTKKIREFSNIPIIISSARSDFDDKNIAFSYGADDYLPKPYDIRELVLRIKSNIKRYEKPSNIFEINNESRTILENGRSLNITPAEYFIMYQLITNKNRVVGKESLLFDFDSDLKTVEVLIGRIRKKIHHNCIETVRGVGYKFIC